MFEATDQGPAALCFEIGPSHRQVLGRGIANYHCDSSK